MKALRDIPGVRVEVNADFNDTVEEHIRDIKPDRNASAPIRTSETQEDSTQTTGKGGGQPGPVAQGPNRQGASDSGQQTSNTTTHRVDESEMQVAVVESQTVKRGFTPKEVWATVAIPSTYLEGLWKARNPTATAAPKPDDLTAIKTQVVTNVEEIVEPLLILQVNKGQNQYKHVRVVVLDSLPTPVIAPPSFASNAMAMANRHWSTLAMLGVAVFSLMVLRSVVNGRPGETPGAAVPSQGLTLHADEPKSPAAEAADEAEENRPRLRLKKGKTLKDDLVEIVREDPDAAADILRSWIGKAG
jgi:flagellar M-ring protein FliF